MRKGTLVLFIMALTLEVFAQREVDDIANPSFGDHLYFGGGFGLSGGSDGNGNRYFFIGVYPIVGYMVDNRFSVGMGVTYQYYTYPDVNLDIHQYGVSPFARYNFGQVFLYGEYMILSTPTFINFQRTSFDRLPVGIGYSQPIGKRVSINGMGLYDVIWKSSDFAFASPWVFRVFFIF